MSNICCKRCQANLTECPWTREELETFTVELRSELAEHRAWREVGGL
jgi:hypothetical protein